MHNPAFVQYFKSVKYLLKDTHCFGFLKLTLFFQKFIECTSVAELVDKVVIVLRTQHFNVLNNVLVRWDG